VFESLPLDNITSDTACDSEVAVSLAHHSDNLRAATKNDTPLDLSTLLFTGNNQFAVELLAGRKREVGDAEKALAAYIFRGGLDPGSVPRTEQTNAVSQSQAGPVATFRAIAIHDGRAHSRVPDKLNQVTSLITRRCGF